MHLSLIQVLGTQELYQKSHIVCFFSVLFVDFGENYSVVDRVQLTFAYSHLDGGMQRVRTWAREGARERAMSLAADSDDAVSIDSVDSNRVPFAS